MATRCKHGMIKEQCSICRQTYARYQERNSRAEEGGSASAKSKKRNE